MTPAARPFAASVAALAVFAVPAPAFALPGPAAAAPASCAGAERYAAQSGAEMLRLSKLSVRPHDASGDGRGRGGGRGDKPGRDGGGDRGLAPSTGPDGRVAPDAAVDGGSAPGAAADDAAAPGVADTDGGASRGKGDAPHGNSSGTAGTEAAAEPAAGPGGEALKPIPGREQRSGRRAVSVDGLRVGEAKSALVAELAPNAAAVSRMLSSSDEPRLSKPLIQQAPKNAKTGSRRTPAAESGPLLVDAGNLTSDAEWQSGMACGAAFGEVTRAVATLGAAQVGGDGDAALVGVPMKVESVSTTALEKAAGGARSVAVATVTAGTLDLLGGAVTIKVLRAPTLRTSMSTVEGGEVRYRPAAIEVSGDGVKTTKLDTVGDSMEMTFSERQTESLRLPEKAGGTLSELPLPAIPGLPALPGEGEPESMPAPGKGTSVKVSLGDVRQATVDHAVAARATAIKIGITQAGEADGYGAGADVTLDLGVGVLESAAVAPEPAGAGVSDAVGGAGGSLPITGPRIDLMALAGAAFLILGACALVFGVRRHRFHA